MIGKDGHGPARLRPYTQRSLVPLLALASGTSAANIYYSQSILGLIARSFDVSGAMAASAVAAAQFGYLMGLVFLVPWGDGIDRRTLILCQAAGLVAALALVASAPTFLTFALASTAVGVGATIALQVVMVAADTALQEHRGRVVGTVMSGLLAGVLLARVVSGAVGGAFGWRAVYGSATAVAAVMLVALYAVLPASPPRHPQPYWRLLSSLGQVLRRHPQLQRASLVQGLLFASFSAFWATVALLLEGPTFGLGPFYAGLFGVLGLVGVFVAPLAGVLSDRYGPDGVTRAGIAAVVMAFPLMAFVPGLPGLVFGVVALDAGLQLAMISQQSIIFGLDDTLRARVNTIYVAALFAGGTVGSLAGSIAWNSFGWWGICVLGTVLALSALAMHRWTFRLPITVVDNDLVPASHAEDAMHMNGGPLNDTL